MMSKLIKECVNKNLFQSLKIEIDEEMMRIHSKGNMSKQALLVELIIIAYEQYVCNIKEYKDRELNKQLILLLKILIDIMEKNKDEK